LCNLYIRLQQQIPDSIKNYTQLHNIQFNLEDVDEDLVNKVKPVTNEEIENDEEEIENDEEEIENDEEEIENDEEASEGSDYEGTEGWN
jgi:hypothetical protein